LWRYAELRPKLLESATLISKEEAERRVLVLENPRLRGTTFITTTLYAGLQIILPGEIAKSHRHTPSALRFLVEGEGGYTLVGGERADMHPGDFVVTPAWSWHAHGNDGAGPVVWMDGLDTPFSRFFGATFRENHAGTENAPARADGDSLAAYGANLLPVDYKPENPSASPLLRYPYERTRASLHRLSRQDAPHPAHGLKMRYANPLNGSHPFPTMAVFMQLLPAGFAGEAYRSTDGTVFSVVEGSGVVEIAGNALAFCPRDIFVVPSWTPYRLKSKDEAVLFSFSDRAAQETLGFWREETGAQLP
jgi:gentisate 1,2-dioxygenase